MKTKLSVLLILFLVSVGCGSTKQHPSDVAAKVLAPAHSMYEGFERTLLALYDAAKPACSKEPRTGDAVLCTVYDNWNQIDDLNDKVNGKLTAVDDAWIALSKLDTPENQAELQKQLDAFQELLNALMRLIPIGQNPQVHLTIDSLRMEAKRYGQDSRIH